MSEGFDLLEQCNIDKGDGDNCLICPLKKAKICIATMKLMEKYKWTLIKQQLGNDAREWILSGTFYAFQIIVKKKLKENESLGIQYLNGIFSNKKADYYKELNERFSDYVYMELPNPSPEGLEKLIDRHPNHLSYEAGRLYSVANLPKEIGGKLIALSDNSIWLYRVRQLARNSCLIQTVSIDAGEDPIDIPSETPSPEDLVIATEKPVYCNPYLKVWRLVGTRQATGCIDLFNTHGESFLDEENKRNRADIAASLGILENSVTQRIKRCKNLIHEWMIEQFSSASAAGSCIDLFVLLYRPRQGPKVRVEQRYLEIARKWNITEKKVVEMVRTCRRVALSKLEPAQ